MDSCLSLVVENALKNLRRDYGEYGVQRLRELLIAEANVWAISKELAVPKVVVSFLSCNLATFIRLTEEKKANLTLVYVAEKVAA